MIARVSAPADPGYRRSMAVTSPSSAAGDDAPGGYPPRAGAPVAAKRRRAVLLLAALGILLAGCNVGEYKFTKVEGRGGWRAEKERACMAARQPSPTVTEIGPITEEGTCGMDFPLEVTALSGGTVAISPPAKMGCPLADALEAWIADSVQPAAMAHFGVQVVEIKQISAYACRNRNNFGRELSEHAFGNALDVSGFKLANGREISVQSGWKGSADERAFLRQAFGGACRHFTTVLGPGSNIMHYNHIHMDLAKLAPDGSPKMCKPPIHEASDAPPLAAADEPAAAVPVAVQGTAVPGAD